MDYYKKLQEKYLYDEDTIYYLRKIIPILIRYYGSNVEDIIYSAIMNCEIHVRKSIDENINDYMNKYYNLNKEWNIPSLVVGFYHNQLIKENGVVIAKPIIYINPSIYEEKFHFSWNEDNLTKLTHEICHLIKNFNRLTRNGNYIIDNIGLSKDVYFDKPDCDELEFIESVNVGIEEANNSYDEDIIMRMLTLKKKNSYYNDLLVLMKSLRKYRDIDKIIFIAQFSNSDIFVDYLGKINSKILIDNFEYLYNLELQPVSIIYDSSKKEELERKRNNIINNIKAFINNYKENVVIDDKFIIKSNSVLYYDKVFNKKKMLTKNNYR